MLKIYILLICLTYSIQISFAQDYLITKENDTIKCTIDKLKTDGFTYSTNTHDSIKYTDFDDISSYYQSYAKFIYGISSGLSFGSATIYEYPSSQYYHFHEKQGIHFGCEIKYAVNSINAIGLKYDLILTNNHSKNVEYIDSKDNVMMLDDVKNSNQKHYLGISVAPRFPIGKRRISIELGTGYIFYKEESKFIENVRISSHSFGMNVNVQYDVKIQNKLSIGCFIGTHTGSINKWKYDYGDHVETIKADLKSDSKVLFWYNMGISIKSCY